MNFGARLKELRKERNLTQLQLANAFELGESTISFYESGKRTPDYDILKNICDFFDVTTDYILGFTSKRVSLNLEDEVLDANDSVKIPVLGVVTAGLPICAEENILGYEYVDKNEAKNGDYFYLKVKGDSMINARIMDGDLVFIKKQQEVFNGEIAVVLINKSEATLKRVLKTKDTIILQPENPKYIPMVFNKNDIENERIQILGKVIHVKFLL